MAFSYAGGQRSYADGYYGDRSHTVTLQFTGDLAAHRRAARRVYPGPLCVQAGRYRARVLTTDQNQSSDDPIIRPTWLGSSRVGDRVVVDVAVADRTIVVQASKRWGGAVQIVGWLKALR